MSTSFLSPDSPAVGGFVLSTPILNQTFHAVYGQNVNFKISFSHTKNEMIYLSNFAYIPNVHTISAINIDFFNWQLFFNVIIAFIVRFII